MKKKEGKWKGNNVTVNKLINLIDSTSKLIQ